MNKINKEIVLNVSEKSKLDTLTKGVFQEKES